MKIDKQFELYSNALIVHAERSKILASNLANQDTPGFKAKDLDFQAILSQVSTNLSAPSQTREIVSKSAQNLLANTPIKYRVNLQPSLDGNTVDSQVEQMAFSQNSIAYLANLNFLTNKIQGIMKAITCQR